MRDLATLLNNAGRERIDEIDTSSLPTFGGDAPSDTDGIYSWDERHVLVVGWYTGNGWDVVPRDEYLNPC